MKGGIAAAFAAMAGSATAMNHRHAHELFAKRGAEASQSCDCSTIWTTTTGEPTLVPPPPVATETTTVCPEESNTPTTPTSTFTPTPTSVTPVSTSTVKLPVPTPEPITCPTPGTYTFTATTVTLSETTTVCAGSSTTVPPGTHTVGGVTTVVETATTVTCPVATVTTNPGGVVTSTIVNTEHVCPSAGTYTIAPITTTVTEPCTIDYPVPTTYNPGTYTAPHQVITVTDTDFVTVCPYTSSEELPTSTPTPTPEPVPEPTTQAPEPPSTTSSAKPPPKTHKPKPKPSNNGGGDFNLGPDNGDHYGITYTPYNGNSGDCKAAFQVDKDIQEIKNAGFNVVRIYSTDCNTLTNVGNACKKHGLEMILGLFVKETGCSANTPDIKEQIDAIKEWGQWDLVKLFVIGNEAIQNGYCTASELRSLVQSVKSSCSSYTGAYTIAETINQWTSSDVSSALCDVVDFTGANVHPFFNPATLASLAGTFVKGQLSILDAVCPGKKSINLECGWPTGGNCNGQACPGKDEQAEAFKNIREAAGSRTVFFSFENDQWKEPGEYDCEQSWGIQDYFQLL